MSLSLPRCKWPGCYRDTMYSKPGYCQGHAMDEDKRLQRLSMLRDLRGRHQLRLSELEVEIAELERGA